MLPGCDVGRLLVVIERLGFFVPYWHPTLWQGCHETLACQVQEVWLPLRVDSQTFCIVQDLCKKSFEIFYLPTWVKKQTLFFNEERKEKVWQGAQVRYFVTSFFVIKVYEYKSRKREKTTFQWNFYEQKYYYLRA